MRGGDQGSIILTEKPVGAEDVGPHVALRRPVKATK
jgi:hypothetical protein